MNSDNNLDMLYLTSVDQVRDDIHVWNFDYDAELDAIRRYHISQVATSNFTGHHLICYKDGKRIARITVRPFDAYQEKQNAFAVLFMMVPVIDPDSIILFSDVWMRAIDLQPSIDNGSLSPADDPMSKHFVSPSKSQDRQEAITVIAMDKLGYSTTIMPYRRHDAAVFWHEDLTYAGEFVAFNDLTVSDKSEEYLEVQEIIANSFLIRMMKDALMTDKPEGVSEQTAYWMLENQGYEIKKY